MSDPLLSPIAWSLVDTLHRAKHDAGPAVTEHELLAFWREAAELRNHGLAVNFGTTMMITAEGDAAVRRRGKA